MYILDTRSPHVHSNEQDCSRVPQRSYSRVTRQARHARLRVFADYLRMPTARFSEAARLLAREILCGHKPDIAA